MRTSNDLLTLEADIRQAPTTERQLTMRMELRLEGKTRGMKRSQKETRWILLGKLVFFLPSIRICQIFDTQRAQQGSEVLDADRERPQESQAVIWHRLVVPGSPGVVEELLDDLNSCGGKRRATSGKTVKM